MNIDRLQRFVESQWQGSILERLQAFVRIPNKSPQFDPEWEAHGHMERAVQLVYDWCSEQPVPGMTVRVQRVPGLTPVLLLDIPGELPGCVLFYGHLDKQPEFTGWSTGLGPWEPVVRDGRLYGRGAADDGYAVFSSLSAIVAAKEQRVALPRCIVLIEASEESGSIHLIPQLEVLGDELGKPDLVVCLDAECGNYEQLWCTTSLRGNLSGRLTVRVLNEGVHSGLGTGIAPTPFRILEQLLARVENPVNGELLLDELRVAMPRDRHAQIATAARVLGTSVAARLPFATGVQPVTDNPVALLINNTWRATLAITGADGLPSTTSAGGVLLPELTVKLSLRLPPSCDAARAAAALRAALEDAPPYGAHIRFEADPPTAGWNAPPFAQWLEASMQCASQALFGREAVYLGSGGTIPFMAILGERFPRTQFLVTGVLGPHSNAHGPNEFLHLSYAQRLTACLAVVLEDFAAQRR